MSQPMTKIVALALFAGLLGTAPAMAKDTAPNNSGPAMTREEVGAPPSAEPRKQLSPEEQKQVEELRASIRQQREAMMANVKKLHEITGEPMRRPHGWGKHKAGGEGLGNSEPAGEMPVPPPEKE